MNYKLSTNLIGGERKEKHKKKFTVLGIKVNPCTYDLLGINWIPFLRATTKINISKWEVSQLIEEIFIKK